MFKLFLLISSLLSSQLSLAEEKSCLSFHFKIKKYKFLEEKIDIKSCVLELEFFQYLEGKYRLEMHAQIEEKSPLRDIFPGLKEVFFKSESYNAEGVKALVAGTEENIKMDFDVNKIIHPFTMKVTDGEPLTINAETGFKSLHFDKPEEYWGYYLSYEDPILIEAKFFHKDIKGLKYILDKVKK